MKAFFKSKKHPWWICSVPGDCAMVWMGKYGIVHFARARFIKNEWIMQYSGPIADAPKRKAVQDSITPVKGAPCLIDQNNNVPVIHGEWCGLTDYLKTTLNIQIKKSGASAVRKGKSGEREVADIYREWHGDPKSVERNLDQHKNGGGDLVGPGLNGWYVEVKRTNKMTINKWIAQCDKGAPDHKTPVAIWWRPDDGQWKIWVRINGTWHTQPWFYGRNGTKELLSTPK